MGDFQANFLRPDAGINTIEWNVVGLQAGLSKKLLIEQSLFKEVKAKIKADSKRGKLRIDNKFNTDVGMSREEWEFRSNRWIGHRARISQDQRGGGEGAWQKGGGDICRAGRWRGPQWKRLAGDGATNGRRTQVGEKRN
ncbi:hypothetical protein ACHAW5_007057 [Stephanodiscus triporus]|uniref:Uncharacterized protein n=1 Tax=Stephanodiscus triporus TaxID=2934178 RepID=A0ABD3NMI1_9STRA